MKSVNLKKLMQGVAVTSFTALVIVSCSGRNNSSNNRSSADTTTTTLTTTPKVEETPPQPFIYSSPTPVDGVLKGVVELGSTGFNSFVVNIDKQKNWELKKSDFGSSLVYENLATNSDVVKGLRNYIADMISYGVRGQYIYFVVSSSASRLPKVQEIIKELKGMKYVVHTVTAGEEAEWGFLTATPAESRDKCFMVDIGSGNTKIAWLSEGKVQTRETYGAKYSQNNVEHQTVKDEITKIANEVPENLRQYCFIIGGVPFKMAKENRVEKERFTVLHAPSTYVFDGEREQSGVNIYDALRTGSKCKSFVFDWDANFVIGYLLK
jgi:hypothetical protein